MREAKVICDVCGKTKQANFDCDMDIEEQLDFPYRVENTDFCCKSCFTKRFQQFCNVGATQQVASPTHKEKLK